MLVGSANLNKQTKEIQARFHKTPSGTMPVRVWLLSLNRDDKRIIGGDIATVEYGWPVGMPTCRPLGNGLYEVRSSLTSRRISRIIFCMRGKEMVLLHGFIKKSQKTPSPALALARKRMKEIDK